MNVAIVGAREFGTSKDGTPNKGAWTLLTRMFNGLTKRYGTFTFVSGGAKGADSMAEYVANKRGLDTRIFCLHNRPELVVETIASGETLSFVSTRVCAKAGHIPQDYGWSRMDSQGVETPQKDAGYKRNVVIVDNADLVVAFVHEESKGTRHTIHLALEAGKPVRMFHTFTGVELTACPCDDTDTHTRIRNSRIYNTVSIAERDETLDGGSQACDCGKVNHWHTVSQHPENIAEQDEFTAALWLESECNTCGREMPDPAEGCRGCATENYGLIEQPIEDDDPAAHPDITGHNYFVKPRYIPTMMDPHIGAAEKRLVNGYWLYTRLYGKLVYPNKAALVMVEQRLKSLPEGPATLPASTFTGVKVRPERKVKYRPEEIPASIRHLFA